MSEAKGSVMVDVGAKEPTRRTATAEAFLTTRPDVVTRVVEGGVAKGDPLRAAEIAGLFGIKRTPDLLPMCHPIPVSGAEVQVTIVGANQLRVVARATTLDRTGIEMEVLTAASIAALTLYDMLKAYDPGMRIGPVRVLEKTGGKTGDWTAPD